MFYLEKKEKGKQILPSLSSWKQINNVDKEQKLPSCLAVKQNLWMLHYSSFTKIFVKDTD